MSSEAFNRHVLIYQQQLIQLNASKHSWIEHFSRMQSEWNQVAALKKGNYRREQIGKQYLAAQAAIKKIDGQIEQVQLNILKAQENSSLWREYEANKQQEKRDENEAVVRAMLAKQLSEPPEMITVLFIASNPLDQTELRLGDEVHSIDDKIQKAKYRDVKLVTFWGTQALDLLDAINRFDPIIVHFSGHGSSQGEIVFQDKNGLTQLVSKEAIAQARSVVSKKIKLVFFNACYTDEQAEEVVKHIPLAVGMNAAIGDIAARVFSAQFYSAIGFGKSIKNAFEQAKAALMLENIPEHNTPELFAAVAVDPDKIILVRSKD